MRTSIFTLATLGFAILAGHGAAAQSNWYIGASASAAFVADVSRSTTLFNGSGRQGPGTNTTTFNPGEAIDVALGYRLPFSFRIEADFGYTHYKVDTIDPLSTNGAFPRLNGMRLSNASGGDRNRFTEVVNLFYDLPISYAGLTPYIGGGAGYFHGWATDAVFRTSGGTRFTQRGATGGAALVLGEIGVSCALTPKLSLVPAYRYEYSIGPLVSHGANIVKLGLRYAF